MGDGPSSSVHAHETNDPIEELDGSVDPWDVEVDDSERLSRFQSFRHGGWLPLRSRMRAAMVAADATEKQLERFDCCGKNAVLYKSPSTGRTAIFGSFCKCRTCIPCGTARSNLIARNLTAFLGPRPTRFLTLTLKHRDEALGDGISRIWSSFKLLRKRPEWVEHVTGFAAFLEAKWKETTETWHVHLHIIFEGSYWDQRDISKCWHVCTGDSFIVDIRAGGTNETRAYYGAKYACKPFDAGSIREPHILAIAVREFAHRRLWQIGGEWKGKLKLLEKPAPVTDWEFVCGLDHLFEQAEHGTLEAVALVAEIRQSISASARPPPPE